MFNIITAQEARQKQLKQKSNTEKMLKDINSRIKEAVKYNRDKIFIDNLFDIPLMTPEVIWVLRDNGYAVIHENKDNWVEERFMIFWGNYELPEKEKTFGTKIKEFIRKLIEL